MGGEANAGAYYHKCFLRNEPSICSNMKSISTKNSKKSTSHYERRHDTSTDVVSKKHSKAINSIQNSRDTSKMAPKKNFKIRKDEENLNDSSGFYSYVKKEECSRYNNIRCVKKARAA